MAMAGLIWLSPIRPLTTSASYSIRPTDTPIGAGTAGSQRCEFRGITVLDHVIVAAWGLAEVKPGFSRVAHRKPYFSTRSLDTGAAGGPHGQA
jgi:hypothetical protein